MPLFLPRRFTRRRPRLLPAQRLRAAARLPCWSQPAKIWTWRSSSRRSSARSIAPPNPAAPAFVDTGGKVKKGQVLCIIEAMKLMNEINAECDGEIVKVYVENGQAVQYGERLFAIRPS